jgi:hypothetical protein
MHSNVIPILNERNRRGRRGERSEKEREEAKKRKMSERMVNRIIRDSHNKRDSNNTHVMIMKSLHRALLIATIQGKSNELRWRDKGYDEYDCVIERYADEESKELDPQCFDWQSQTKKETSKDNEYK